MRMRFSARYLLCPTLLRWAVSLSKTLLLKLGVVSFLAVLSRSVRDPLGSASVLEATTGSDDSASACGWISGKAEGGSVYSSTCKSASRRSAAARLRRGTGEEEARTLDEDEDEREKAAAVFWELPRRRRCIWRSRADWEGRGGAGAGAGRAEAGLMGEEAGEGEGEARGEGRTVRGDRNDEREGALGLGAGMDVRGDCAARDARGDGAWTEAVSREGDAMDGAAFPTDVGAPGVEDGSASRTPVQTPLMPLSLWKRALTEAEDSTTGTGGVIDLPGEGGLRGKGSGEGNWRGRRICRG